ncbi:MAG: GNAT family N-acetyltransferase [Chloroflexales bacterium]|nr:GNAT family N-acetyltransferase [Chloroflexales bacterium]
MATEMVTLRPATAADAEALADLVVQLYHSEVPRGLRGPRDGQVRLFRYLIEHELLAGVRGRFLAVDAADSPIGSASVRLWGDQLLTSLPPRVLSVATRSLGIADTLRLFGTTLRSALVAETPLRRDECFVYSVVVTEPERGRGVGAAIMEQIEDYARQAGARTALLRVIIGNARARHLYLKLGYHVVSRTPLWADLVGMPSELLRKDLG